MLSAKNTVSGEMSKAIVPHMQSRVAEKLVNEERRKLFDLARVANEEYQEALKVAKQKLDARSAAIREILDNHGPGPWLLDNEEVRIVVRPDRKTKEETVFFRRINTKDVESI